MRTIVKIRNGIARQSQYRFRESINIDIYEGEPIAILGSNGSGKSMLIDILTGKIPLSSSAPLYDFGSSASQRVCDNIKIVTFCDVYGDASSGYYYQQRWNRGVEAEVEEPRVKDLLGGHYSQEDEFVQSLYKDLGIQGFMEKNLCMLSSGEYRRFQLVKSLLEKPKVLIIDNPFIGLDQSARAQIVDFLQKINEHHNILLILVTSQKKEIPDFIHKVIYLDKMSVKGEIDKDRCGSEGKCSDPSINKEALKYKLLGKVCIRASSSSKELVCCKDVNIKYGNRVILNNFNWTVLRGEKWALCGMNGSGKSTLLSLIYADNPQAYACDISLFGSRRGTGESIWDIKKRIGYVSPEMFRSYRKNIRTIEIVASGLHDTIGLYRKMTEDDAENCQWWMDLFGIGQLAQRSFLTLSSGEQRLALLARAFVKDPELLILDEPFHGLDERNIEKSRAIIDCFCSRVGKTLIMVSHNEAEFPQCINRRLNLVKHV